MQPFVDKRYLESLSNIMPHSVITWIGFLFKRVGILNWMVSSNSDMPTVFLCAATVSFYLFTRISMIYSVKAFYNRIFSLLFYFIIWFDCMLFVCTCINYLEFGIHFKNKKLPLSSLWATAVYSRVYKPVH